MSRLAALACSLVCALALPTVRAAAQQAGGATGTAVSPPPAAPAQAAPGQGAPSAGTSAASAPGATATTAAAPAAAPPPTTMAAPPSTQATAQAATQITAAPRLVLPVVVIGIPDRAVQPATLAAIRDAVVAGLAPAAGGRPVVALPDEARIAAVAACRDAACLGARLNELQAMAGVFVRATRRNRTAPIDVRVEVLDPVSGAARLATPVSIALPAAAESAPAAALAVVLAQLVSALPWPPPPPPSLLVVTNVDDAVVTLDGNELGRAPLAAVEVAPGRHNVVVTARGWQSGNRMVQVGETGLTRADFDLEPEGATRAALESGHAWSGGSGGTGPAEPGGEETPLYARWYVIGGAAAVVVATVVLIAVAASSGDPEIGPPAGIPVPPIQPR